MGISIKSTALFFSAHFCRFLLRFGHKVDASANPWGYQTGIGLLTISLDMVFVCLGFFFIQSNCPVFPRSQCVDAVSPNSSDPALVQQKRTFLRLLRTASSFCEMAVQLKEMMDWCRRCELHQERRHLALLLLRCQRMRALDGEGIRYGSWGGTV